jgi:RNA polymerase sigma-70 factor (ECF subfamily)
MEDRRDLVQEMMLQAWQSYKNFRAEAAFSTWLYRIALNTAISYLKKETRRPDRFATDFMPAIADHTDNETEEQLRVLYAAIKQLNDIEKALIALYFEKLPHQTIAEVLGISANHVAVKLARVKEKLALIIKQHEP